MEKTSYVLVTPARNEEQYIEKTIRAVVSQSKKPIRWIIVNDNSTDGTADIVREYIHDHRFISLIYASKKGQRNFASKVFSFLDGYELLKNVDYQFIGNLDADVTFGRDYFERVLKEFSKNEKLGVAGGFVYEQHKGQFVRRANNRTRSVAGAVQLFRRQCYEDIGGFSPLKFGAEDTVAQIKSRMLGWQVRSFPDIRVFHHRPTGGTGSTAIRSAFQQGGAEHVIGYHPLFEIAKNIYRLLKKPYVISAAARMAGYLWFFVRQENREVSPDVIKFLRHEQIQLLKRGSLFKGRHF